MEASLGSFCFLKTFYLVWCHCFLWQGRRGRGRGDRGVGLLATQPLPGLLGGVGGRPRPPLPRTQPRPLIGQGNLMLLFDWLSLHPCPGVGGRAAHDALLVAAVVLHQRLWQPVLQPKHSLHSSMKWLVLPGLCRARPRSRRHSCTRCWWSRRCCSL